ncbi:hypothetical protein [Pseudomonas weihenstephanensis]|uniref:hypothetical protein n=1 Tax=Pseudomonas weihenstephanensis TaxID=1608994 RepID=UPI000ABA5115|nr:hypothetical protein [Pseudomonas weihenstephanensis]
MSPALTIFLLFSGWLAVAAAMLWGVMRISRRHHPQTVPAQKKPADTPKINTANAH